MNRTVILAAGEFPARGGEPWRILASASRVVACDSAVDAFRRAFGRMPDVAIGDFDSIESDIPANAVINRDPSSNDLSKAIALCRKEGWADPVVVGATGRREDHSIGNIYRALEAQLRVATDCGDFLPVGGEGRGVLKFRAWIGAGVSVFAPDPATKMESKGLKWALAGVKFENAYCATLNRASSENVTVKSDRPAFVFVERNPAAKRVIVSLGSNVGNRASYLHRALASLSRMPHTRLLDFSSVVETDPVGVPREFAAMKFLNQAAIFETELEPLAFSRAMHEIEDRLGRVRTVRNGPRTIDIDLVAFGGVKMRSRELTLPHPRAACRDFVTGPVGELLDRHCGASAAWWMRALEGFGA